MKKIIIFAILLLLLLTACGSKKDYRDSQIYKDSAESLKKSQDGIDKANAMKQDAEARGDILEQLEQLQK